MRWLQNLVGGAQADRPRLSRLDAPRQRIVEAIAELKIVERVDEAIAVEIEVRLVTAANGFVEGIAVDEVVAGVDDGEEVDAKRAAAGRRGKAGVAVEAVEGRRPIGGHVDARNAEGMHLGGVDIEVIDAIFE